jgi:glycosyltransferase involved in cell wall biosynthesis
MSLVSIIIPTRNRAALLRQTILSVLDQTWAETEIIVVDEASEDDTEAVLDRFAKEIRVVRHDTPQGPSAARNVGVDTSSGEYVIFLDDDDLLHPRHVEELVQFAEDLPSGHIAASGWRRFRVSEAGVEIGAVVRPPETWEAPGAIRAIFGHDPGCLVWGPSALWPRSLVTEIQWDEELFTNGDVDFYSRVLLRGAKFAGTESGMAYYRSHRGVSVSGKSASRSQSGRSMISSARCRIKHSQLLKNHPQRSELAPAMRDSLMRMLITLEARGGLSDWVPRIKNAYADWGGDAYYLPQPPQHPIKRRLLKTALSFGGPKAVGLLLRGQSWIRRIMAQESSESDVETMEYEPLMRRLTDAESAPVDDVRG